MLLLFTIYINDLPRNTPNSKVYLYADDTSFIVREGEADVAMAAVKRWFDTNKLKMNVDKMQVLGFPTVANGKAVTFLAGSAIYTI